MNNEIKPVNRIMKGVRVGHKKEAIFDIQVDLSRFVNRELTADDVSKDGNGKSYVICSTGGNLKLTAPGFENCTLSVMVLTNKGKYDEKTALEEQRKAAQAELAQREKERAVLDRIASLDDAKMAKLMELLGK